MRTGPTFLARAVVAFLLSCGSACSSPSDNDASTDAVDDIAASDDTSVRDAAMDGEPPPDVVSGCPAQIPTEGDPCSPPGRSCEYGSVSWRDCNSSAVCTTRGWSVHAPIAGDICLPNNTMCPASNDAITHGGACDNGGLECFYRESTCYCPRPGMTDGGMVWICDDPAPGCPSPRPFLGTTCSNEGQECDYGECFLHNVRERCQGGVWVSAATDCDGG